MLSSLSVALILAATPLEGRTVFAGERTESFGVQILDTLPNGLGPRVPLILVRLTGKRIEHTGVIAGMSGSPVYRDGQLMGAVGYRIGTFSKEPIAGITPIDAMRATLHGQASAARPAKRLAAVHLPLVASGMDAAVSEPLMTALNALSPVGLTPVAGGGTGTGKAPRTLTAGGALAVVLAHGDINLFALGTVTEVSNQQFLGFGHPMFGWGALQIPVATAWVSTTIASPYHAFKVGRLGQLVGTMTQDRLPAIAGTIGPIPPMIPVTVHQTTGDQIRAEVVRHRRLTASLASAIVHQAARRRIPHQAGGTLALTGSIETAHGTLRLDEWVAHPHHPNLARDLASSVAFLVGLLQDNPLGSIDVTSITTTLKHEPSTHLSSLRRVDLLNPHPRAGATLDLRLTWRGYQTQTHEEHAHLKLPTGLSPGPAQVVVASGSAIDGLERRCGDGRPPKRLEQLVPWLNARASTRQRGIFLVRPLATQSHGERRALSTAWSERLPSIDRDAVPGSCLIVARQMLTPAQGPTEAQMSTFVQIQGAHR